MLVDENLNKAYTQIMSLASAVILAAGSGQRMGKSIPKQIMTINGRMLVDYSVGVFSGHPRIDRVILVVNEHLVESMKKLYPKLTVLVGGASRRESCQMGLRAVDSKYVLVHDAARPMVTDEVVTACLDGLDAGAVISVPFESPVDSLVVDRQFTVRTRVQLIQTPQAFHTDALQSAHAGVPGDSPATDDVGLVLSHMPDARMHTFTGPKSNFKITFPQDFRLAELLLEKPLLCLQSASNYFNAEGKRALVLGAGGGIGAAVADALEARGASVTRSTRFMYDPCKDDIIAVHGHSSWDIIVDAIGTMTNADGKSIITNFANMSMDDMAYCHTVNFLGPVKTAKLAEKCMVTGGHLLFIGSSSTRKGRALFSGYSSAKAALFSFTQSLAEEFAERNITVNCLHPSRTDTPMRKVFSGEDKTKMLRPSEVAGVAMCFCSGALTGHNHYIKVGDI